MKFNLSKNKAKILLGNNEQVTFFQDKSSFDVARKDWGFYLTPSLQGRCLKKGYKCFLIMHNKDLRLFFVKKKFGLKKINLILKKNTNKIVKFYTNDIFVKFFKK